MALGSYVPSNPQYEGPLDRVIDSNEIKEANQRMPLWDLPTNVEVALSQNEIAQINQYGSIEDCKSNGPVEI